MGGGIQVQDLRLEGWFRLLGGYTCEFVFCLALNRYLGMLVPIEYP